MQKIYVWEYLRKYQYKDTREQLLNVAAFIMLLKCQNNITIKYFAKKCQNILTKCLNDSILQVSNKRTLN